MNTDISNNNNNNVNLYENVTWALPRTRAPNKVMQNKLGKVRLESRLNNVDRCR